MILFREAKGEEISKIMYLDHQLRLDLQAKRKSDFLEPLTEEEARQGLNKPSTIILAYDEYASGNQFIGFVLLREMTIQEEGDFERAFDNFKPGKALMIREVGFYPSNQKAGNCMVLLEEAKRYAKLHQFEQFAGALHPDDLQSQNAILSIWERGKALRFDNQCVKMNGGKGYLRQRFLLNPV